MIGTYSWPIAADRSVRTIYQPSNHTFFFFLFLFPFSFSFFFFFLPEQWKQSIQRKFRLCLLVRGFLLSRCADVLTTDRCCLCIHESKIAFENVYTSPALSLFFSGDRYGGHCHCHCNCHLGLEFGRRKGGRAMTMKPYIRFKASIDNVGRQRKAM